MKFRRSSQNSIIITAITLKELIKLLTRLKVILSHRCEHQFKHSFQDTLNPTCNYGEDIETSSHYLLHFPDYLQERMTLLKAVRRIDPNILDSNNAQ